jgi:predicted metalloprotease with PDZ domain
MFRIWSTEWINNRESEEQRMLDFINEAIVSYEKGEQRQEQSLPKKSDNVKVEVVQKKVEEPTKLSFPYYQVGD